jgi:uncharacterized damage-inducible protein DinB
MTKPILSHGVEHHVWATIQIIDSCRALNDEQLATVVPGTFGSIIDTLRHLVGADASYLHVLSGGTHAEVEEADMDLAQLRAVMVRNGPAWAAVLDGAVDPDLMVVRHRDDGSESHAPLGIRLAQVLHHGSDHRSQVATALTSLGVTPPEMDVWDYGDAQGWLDETPPTAPTA